MSKRAKAKPSAKKKLTSVKNISNKVHFLQLEGKSYSQISAELGISKSTISYHLGEGQKLKTKKRTIKRRSTINAYIQKSKTNVPCIDCKTIYHYCQMDYDHVRGVKLFSLSRYHIYTQSLDVVKREIEKCDLVCSNCHRLRTWTRAEEASEERETQMGR